MADGTSPIVPETPDEAVTPRGVNHLVINVRDIAASTISSLMCAT
jgi:hypothetical protein